VTLGADRDQGLALREKLPEASLSDDEIRELANNVLTFRESMQNLRETERTPENAERIRELMGRVEENRQRFETAAGMSINEFLRRTTTGGIDNDRHEKGKVVLETLDGAGR
jgi:transcriptional regulator with AAA-type ATPase domain